MTATLAKTKESKDIRVFRIREYIRSRISEFYFRVCPHDVSGISLEKFRFFGERDHVVNNSSVACRVTSVLPIPSNVFTMSYELRPTRTRSCELLCLLCNHIISASGSDNETN